MNVTHQSLASMGYALLTHPTKLTKYDKSMQTAETPLEVRLWTVAEYHRMAEVGILEPDEPVELIAGQIIKKMSPQGTPHATVITLTRLLLENLLGKQVLVRTQLPITLNNFSEPEVNTAEVGTDETSTVQVDAVEVGTAEVSTLEISPPEVGTAEVVALAK